MEFIKSFLEKTFDRVIDDTTKNAIKYLNNSDSFTRIFEFTVDGIDHYFISLFRHGVMEIHFGQYKKKVFADLWIALQNEEIDKAQQILNDENLLLKDDLANYPVHAIEIILSNVIAMLIKVVEKNDPASIKIMGQTDGFNLYRQFVLDHIPLLPLYYLERDTFDDYYREKNGQEKSAKALLLRSKLADYGKHDLILKQI